MKTRILELRRERGFSQYELAELVYSSQSDISKIERGVREPSASMIRHLCHVLHTSADYLLYLSEHKLPLNVETEIHRIPKKYNSLLTVYHRLSPEHQSHIISYINLIASIS